MTAIVDVQIAYSGDEGFVGHIPNIETLTNWASLVLAHAQIEDNEFTARFVDTSESQALNSQYRNKNSPTNVLSFPFECPADIPVKCLGDLVICVPVIEAEAQQQGKQVSHHYAHMIIHGILHLLGYDHIEASEAQAMESIEIALLAQLSIDDPYQDD